MGRVQKTALFKTHAGYFKYNRTLESLREVFDYIQVFLLTSLKKRMQPRVQKQVKKEHMSPKTSDAQDLAAVSENGEKRTYTPKKFTDPQS